MRLDQYGVQFIYGIEERWTSLTPNISVKEIKILMEAGQGRSNVVWIRVNGEELGWFRFCPQKKEIDSCRINASTLIKMLSFLTYRQFPQQLGMSNLDWHTRVARAKQQ